MNKKMVLAGGTGFIGKYLEEQFATNGYEVIIISRSNKQVQWEDTDALVNAVEGAEIVINLAGKSVDCRYTEKNKKAIFESRTSTTKRIGEAILKCKQPPALWINSSTATIYRHAEDRPMTEAEGEIGSGFSVNVAKEWERSFYQFQLPHTRQIALRMAIVLGKHGGVMKPMVNLVRFGLGGKQGKGNQMFSWIHIEDVYRVILFLQQHTELSGTFNCSSPNPVKNKELMQVLRNEVGMKIGLPTSEWLLKIGAVIIKTEIELILKSRWVIPDRLLKAGFQFKHPDISDAIKSILNN